MIDPKKMVVTVEGVNMQTKHVKPMKEGEQGRIIKRESPVHMSKVVATGETAATEAAPAEAAAEK
jgi:ribosomal protein L24